MLSFRRGKANTSKELADMNTRKIPGRFGRVRTCVQRRDYPRAVYLFAMASRELGGQTAPMVVRGDIRTALADLCGDPVYKKEKCPCPLLPAR